MLCCHTLTPLLLLALALLALTAPVAAPAQTMTNPNPYAPAQPRTKAQSQAMTQAQPGTSTLSTAPKLRRNQSRPLSRVSLGAGVSPLGIGFLAAVNLNRYLDLRGTGSFLNYSINNINTNGFNVNAQLNLATAGAAIDVYPFHNWLRISPGVLFYNQNKATAVFVAAAGTSFTLNNTTYYSASGTNAVTGLGTFGFGNGSVAPTLTAGVGNLFPASGRHWTFPFDIGVAFIQNPTVAINLTGEVCDAQGQNCVNVATDPTVQSNLAAQVASYQNDVQPLHTYPIVSFGVAYNFHIRH